VLAPQGIGVQVPSSAPIQNVHTLKGQPSPAGLSIVTSLSESASARSRSKRSDLCPISATCRRAPSSPVAFRAVIEPQHTRIAFAMPDELEIPIRDQVCDHLRDGSQERLDRLFAVDARHTNARRVRPRKRHLTRSVLQKSVERDQRRFLSGLSFLNRRESHLAKLSCPSQKHTLAEGQCPFRDGHLQPPLEPGLHVVVYLGIRGRQIYGTAAGRAGRLRFALGRAKRSDIWQTSRRR
jgi:hypothetical protein